MSDPTQQFKLDTRRAWKIWRARATIFAERLWPAVLPSLGVVAIFVLVTLFDFWRFLPGLAHYALLGLFTGLLVYYLIRDVARLNWPSRREALARLELDSGFRHAPLRALEDRPFGADAANPLWQAHVKRMEETAAKLRLDHAGAAAVERRDPLALRFGALLLLILAVFLAWGDIAPRFWQAFSPRMNGGVPVTVDLWIDPPAYTGKAPMTLLQSASAPEGTFEQITVPQGAVVHTRIAGANGRGRGRVEVITAQGRERPDLESAGASLIGETELGENSVLVLTVHGRKASWPIAVTPDRQPTIVFREQPAVTENNRVRMVVEIKDDYGITDATAHILLDPSQERPLDAPEIATDILNAPVLIPLTTISGIEGPRTAELDLTEHPWAGLNVLLRIEVADGAGNRAETLSEAVLLPEREFFNPLAQAIIHERRNLAVAPASWPTTTRALDALTFAPDRFFDEAKDYLLLRTAYWDVMNSRGEDIDETVDRFWPLALQLEDQELELARRALEAAQQALREALERGAPPGEIASLVEDLRLAMQNYIQALAESGQAVAEDDGPREELGASDLDEMLDSINDLTQSGANNAARQMLSSLEEMLENLKISSDSSADGATGQQGDPGEGGQGGQAQGQPGADGSGSQQGGGPGSQAMGAAGEMIGRQRELADETFNAEREQNGLSGGTGEARSTDALGAEQSDLADQLSEMIDQFQGMAGTENGDQILDSFADARQAMEDAADALTAGNPAAAGNFQEEALRALRNGAAGIAEEAMQAQEEMADATGQARGNPGQDGEAAALDPLGRPYGTMMGEGIGIPDLSDPEVARELVEKLRRRLSEPGLSRDEIEYLERLLQRF